MGEPRPLREGDTLGRAGRVGPNGGRVETARARRMDPEDKRRAAVNDWAAPGEVEITDNLIVYQPPAEPAAATDDHRALLHNDGTGEPRPPKAWEEKRAAERAEIGRREREALLRLRRQRRDQLTLAQLADRVARRMLTLAQPRAKQTRLTDARSAVDGDRSPQGEGHGAIGSAEEARCEARMRLARLLLEQNDDELAAHGGLPVKPMSQMSGEEKDAILTGARLRGIEPHVIAALFPELAPHGGSAKSHAKHIKYVRACNDQDPLGRPLKRAV